MSRKKICIIVPTHISSKVGGAQYQAQCVTDALVESGKYDVYFIARQTAPYYKAVNYILINISITNKVRRGRFLLDIPSLYKTLVKIEPDYIYQRVGCTFTGVAAYYCRKHNSKMIWHVASDSDVNKKLNLQKQGIIQRLEKKFFEYGIKNTDMIVTQTKDQSNVLFRDYGRRATLIVPNFHPKPSESLIKNSTKNIVWIGNIKDIKRPELFIQLAEKLLDLTNVKFRMIGVKSDNIKWQKLLEQKVDTLDNIEYLGAINHEAVKRVLACSHILINTSKWEGFSNTFIESWMREVPVVTLGINPDGVFTKNRIGYCSSSLDDMTEKVRQLIINDNLRNEYGKNASEYAQKNHSISNINKIIHLLGL